MLKLFFRHDTKKIFISDSVNLSVVNFKLNKLFNISRNKKQNEIIRERLCD